MKDRLKRLFCFLMVAILMVDGMSVLANTTETDTDGIVLANQAGAASIYIDDEGPAYAGLRLIADAVAGDIKAVTGQTPQVVNEEPSSGVMIIAGLVTEDIITNEHLTWEIGASNDSFKNEDMLLTATNKWLIGHAEGGLDAGAFIGLKGKNLNVCE